MPKTTAPARMAFLEHLIQFVSQYAQLADFPVQRIKEIELAVEEVLVNIFNYAYPDDRGDVTLTCRVEAGPRLVVEISDTGIPFNILNVPTPDLTADIDERQVGGLGAFFVKKMADEARYRRIGDRNLLALAFVNQPRGATGQEQAGRVQE